MGCSDLRQLHGAAGDRGGERTRRTRRSIKGLLLLAAGQQTGTAAVTNAATVEPGRQRRGVRPGRHRPLIAGRAYGGANMIVGVDLNPARVRRFASASLGLTHPVNQRDREGRPSGSRISKSLNRRLCRLTASSARQRTCHAPGARGRHRGWASVDHRRRGAGREISDAPFQLVTGPRVQVSRVRRRARPHSTCRRSSPVHGRQDRHRLLISMRVPCAHHRISPCTAGIDPRGASGISCVASNALSLPSRRRSSGPSRELASTSA